MSLRTALTRIWQNGRILVRAYRQRPTTIHPRTSGLVSGEARSSLSPSLLQSHYENARRILVDNVLRRVTNSLSGELRRKTTRQLLFGNSTPFFALVGVSLASGTGIITKEDELEGICWEIREAVSRMQRNVSKAETEVSETDESLNLSKLTIGPLISKGCEAAVYAARTNQEHEGLDDASGGIRLAEPSEPMTKFPFALKMMFNYSAESNALAILRAMYREMVPAKTRCCFAGEMLGHWENSLAKNTTWLPPHPNIVPVHCAFVDRVPEMPGAVDLYGSALPTRINPEGSGRNMTLFLLMKRYEMSLKEYLSRGLPERREGVLLLAQLLEAVSHINRHGVAHRDLKNDNVLVEICEEGCPLLVVADFGCCLSDRTHGLEMPFRTWDTDRGGNPALMPPEVALAEPGMFSKIDYSKSDAWAVGTLAYEIFTGRNPFTRSVDKPDALMSTTYTEEDLPPLPVDVPLIIRQVIYSLLVRNPRKRMSAEFASKVCQLYLWAPSSWLKPVDYTSSLPSSSEMLQWLLCLSTKVLCTSHREEVATVRRSTCDYQLISSFLSRARLSQLRTALAFIHSLT